MKKIISIFILSLLLSGCSTTYFKQSKISTDNNIDKKNITVETKEYRNDLFGFKIKVPNNLYPKEHPTARIMASWDWRWRARSVRQSFPAPDKLRS